MHFGHDPGKPLVAEGNQHAPANNRSHSITHTVCEWQIYRDRQRNIAELSHSKSEQALDSRQNHANSVQFDTLPPTVIGRTTS